MMNKLSVVIPSINRYDSLKKLISDLKLIEAFINEIIVVDATENSKFINLNSNVIQIKSQHKNGLFQRILGASVAKNDFVLFLDNDMELNSVVEFKKLVDKIESLNEFTGIAIGFKNKFERGSQSDIPQSIFKKNLFITKLKNLLSGYSNLQAGEYGFNGNRGEQPKKFDRTNWLSGGAFIAQKNAFLKLINWRIVDFFEYQLGMGEDPLIGYMLSKQGCLYYYPSHVFLHNDQLDSSYSIDKYNLAKRFAFSRLYLTLEKCRLDEKKQVIGYISYYYFIIFRIIGLIINLALNKGQKTNLQLLKGTISGVLLTFKYHLRYNQTSKINWTNILEQHKINLRN